MQEIDTDCSGPPMSLETYMKDSCRSKVVILPKEKHEDFDALCDRWIAAFEPENEAGLHFVEQIVMNAWSLERAIRRYNAVEEKLSGIDFGN